MKRGDPDWSRERRYLEREVEKRMTGDGYLVVFNDRSLLDGEFTSTELRLIADAMDELAKKTEE
jgi:hypothetical protein